MMKRKLFKSSRILVLGLAAAVLIGATYAFFSQEVKGKALIQMGNFDISVELIEDEEEDLVVEPGSELLREGFIKKTGTLPVLVMMKEFGANLTTVSGEIFGHDPSVTCEFDMDKLGYSDIAEDGSFYAWYKVTTMENTYALLMVGANVEAQIAYDVKFSTGMGNKYMGAIANLTNNWTASQCSSAATQEILGFDMDSEDIEMVDNYLGADDEVGTFGTRGRGGFDRAAAAKAYIENAMQKLCEQ